MAVDLESKVMREIGLGNNYQWFNGSGSCGGIRNAAIEKLPSVARKNGLSISGEWIAYCKKASLVDGFGDGAYTLTNTWVACSYAIQDAIQRKEGGGFSPPENPDWYFWDNQKRAEWNRKDMISWPPQA